MIFVFNWGLVNYDLRDKFIWLFFSINKILLGYRYSNVVIFISLYIIYVVVFVLY